MIPGFPATARMTWRKSSRSGDNAGNCVEVSALNDHIAVRDSKNPALGLLYCSRADWRGLTTALRAAS
ncbi:uncharacterized protein DUF397 [Stackebrandtia albiflava]|uniref:Uncharacterized protein DUF397 n=2 Tax=Stackebrandtia albiflava TaxID=406432 RepID=A0A562ULG6_9ACTN|nr:uncharacterized protein DUF397 [Stackebrandtia albiflava]